MTLRYDLSRPQQYLLQIFMNRGVIDQYDFKNVFVNAFNKFEPSITSAGQIPKDQFSKMVQEINEAIKPFSMEIKKGVCEISGITFYCLIRLFDSGSVGKLSHLYNPTELKIFNMILEMIMESDHGYVEYNNILNQINESYEGLTQQAAANSQSVKQLSNKEIRVVIEKFMNDYWLMETFNMPNHITLHGRSILELQENIFGLYNKESLNFCVRCKSLIVMVGLKCNNCQCTYHRACAKEVFEKQSDCLNCKNAIENEQIEELKTLIKAAKDTYCEKYSRI